MSASLMLSLVLASCTPGGAEVRCKKGRCGDTGTPDDATAGLPVTVASTGLRSCAAPALREEQAFDVLLSGEEPPKKAWFVGGGVVAGDFDQDGWDDIVLPGFYLTVIYWGLPDGGFALDTEAFAGMGLTSVTGGSAADYDGDGDLDLFLARFFLPDRLLRNDGGVFVDVTEAAGIVDAQVRSASTSWADYDRDGDLDLFVGGYGFIDQETGGDHSQFAPADPAFLYRNEGDGTFSEIGDTLPAEVHDGYTLAGGWHDLDDDAWPDLYVVNDFGVAYPNALLWNRQGVLERDANSAGLDVALTYMGLGIGDVSGDGRPDMVMPAWDDITLLLSSDHGLWYEWSEVQGIGYEPAVGQKIGWGAEMVDLDNDGDLDIPIAFGWLDSTYPAPRIQRDAVFIQLDDGTFEDRAQAWGLADETVGRGFLAIDVNHDGWVDLLKRDLVGPTRLHISRCGTEAWLKVDLRAPGMNRFAVGARVRVFAGGEAWSRTVRAGGHNFASGGPPRVHFGLGGHEAVRRVEVRWPDGEISNVFDVQTRQEITLTRQ